MPILELPNSIPVADIDGPEGCNPAYDADKIRRHTAIYQAGDAFKSCVEEFLIKRRLEESSEAGDLGRAHYEERKKHAHYIARGSGLIDWLTAAVFKKEPCIVAPGDSTGYWEGLNDDADGLGTPLATLCRDALRQVMLHNRAYFHVDFVAPEAVPAEPDTFAARIKVIKAAAADDWQHDAAGRLVWLRTHTVGLDRPADKPWKRPENQRHVWTFIDAEAIQAFEATRPITGAWKPIDVATRTIAQPHQFGTLPVFEVRAAEGQFVLDRIYAILLGLFNREVSLAFALDQGAYAHLVLMLDSTDVKQIVATEMAALKLRIGESAQFIAPPATVYDPLFRDVDRWRQSLYEVVQALAINAQATQTQNARQPAQAKALDREPLQTLLASFAWPIRESLQKLITALKTYRNEPDLDVQLEGFDDFEATLDDAREVIQGNTPIMNSPSEQASDTVPEAESDAA